MQRKNTSAQFKTLQSLPNVANNDSGELTTDKEFVEYVIDKAAILHLPKQQPKCAIVETLSGNINRVKRVKLQYPDQTEKYYVLKHVPSGGRLERYPTVIFPENRLDFEIMWFEHSKKSSHNSDVRTPLIHLYSKEDRLIVMEDFGNVPTLTALLSSRQEAFHLICALGHYLGQVHAHSLKYEVINNPSAAINRKFVFTLPVAEPDAIKCIWQAKFNDCNESKQRTQQDLNALLHLQEQFLNRYGQALLPILTALEHNFKTGSDLIFTHGDLHTDSLLVLGKSQLGIVDAELADTGTPAFDLGMLIAHIWAIKASGGTSKTDIIDLIARLFKSYTNSYSSLHKLANHNFQTLWQQTLLHCGAELLRRLIGAAGFSFKISQRQTKDLLIAAAELLLKPDEILNQNTI